jgi:formylglycine-generating enzyme
MHDEQSFLQAMQQHPEDNALRLVFADWLEERGDKRGELIRLLHTLTQSVEVPGRSQLEERLRELMASGVKPVGPFWTNSIGMKFAWIPAGKFMMGSPEDEEDRLPRETQHDVTLSKGFFLAIYLVTQPCWQKVMESNPSRWKGKKRPVERVSWKDCQAFLRRLSEQEGHTYRLPTEAEWEFACRAGTSSPYFFGETLTQEQANFSSNETCAVGKFPPNAYGLYDMHGNVNEWCADWDGPYPEASLKDPKGPQRGDLRICRGGFFLASASPLRSAERHAALPTDRSEVRGFRPVMTPEQRQT